MTGGNLGVKKLLYDDFDVKYMTECICQNA